PITLETHTPVDVSGLSSGVLAISAGGSHTCARTTSNSMKCWGSNNHGQLGNNSTSFGATPSDVSGLILPIVVAISTGDEHTCALLVGSGGVRCWGANAYGQLGNNSMTDAQVPLSVSGLPTISAI